MNALNESEKRELRTTKLSALVAIMLLVGLISLTTFVLTWAQLETVADREIGRAYRAEISVYQRVIERIPGGLIQANARTGLVTYMNPGAETILQVHSEDIVGSTMTVFFQGTEYEETHRDIFTPDNWMPVWQRNSSVLQTSGELILRDGNLWYVSAEIHAVLSGSGIREYWVFLDPTKVKNLSIDAPP